MSMVIELLVAGLLAATIGYCITLNRRLTRLRSDEQSLKATIAELITATEIAERAIQGLKVTVRECDGTLGERLRTAERFLVDIEREVKAGETVVERISRITEAARDAGKPRVPPIPAVPPIVPVMVREPGEHGSAASTLAAAKAFAARVQTRAA
ncbi:chemotaxis protein [Phreatobacter cathodiphilus]|uniref:Chemotaxis protein n=1 Tax=Phreatobacter cathodiphilus TaxID=1868589 RepID=A0A2S0NHI4_9HYPH|nr:chemotaxis protein [Phreatobacter cathodiphilus]